MLFNFHFLGILGLTCKDLGAPAKTACLPLCSFVNGESLSTSPLRKAVPSSESFANVTEVSSYEFLTSSDDAVKMQLLLFYHH